ncbi:branched-chain amino acid ABC transporter permease [Vineibacter terrae]|uniref:Branched-chain amino acid ABC transporter permease n=1 Tax=Vineibacter terrae TaxID=2586908 RepID=A0A5C8PA23_9HYPH|nr:branched-chain amino acid ABC transporter permease [Vineibacter terrae]TXL70622.1 branched-chain amino acid ABC transporter permease [Vineibacter terrae]HEX2891614.1 branched-chain amino acid ABC transporter permease [Vineibacter terrae]
MFTFAILSQIALNGITLSAIYILVALGFTLIFGVMRIVNFAHGEFAMLGGFALSFFYVSLGLHFLVALPIAAVAVGAFSLVLERVVYRRFYQREMPGMIASLGVSIALMYGGVALWGTHQRSIPSAFSAVYTIGPIFVTAERVVVIGVCLVSLALFYLVLRFTRIGLAMRVVAEDRITAEAQGIDTVATYRFAFFISTAMAALAGGLIGQLFSLSPFMGLMPLVKAFIVVILGGLGGILGAAIGGLVLGLGESFVSTFYGASAAQFISFGLIIAILLFRPQGLVGRKEG